MNDATDGRLEVFYEEVTQYVEDRCKEAGFELQETLDDHRLDILDVKNAELADFTSVVDQAMIEYKDTINAFKEDAELDIGHDTAARCQRSHVSGRERRSLQEERKLIDEERQLLDKESGLLDEEQQHLEYGRRHLDNKRQHLAKHMKLLDRRRQLLEREQSCSTSFQSEL